MAPIHPLSIKTQWLSSITQSRKDYVIRFNELVAKESPITVTANFFQIKEGLEKLITANQDSIKEKLTVIIDYLKSEVENNEKGREQAQLLIKSAENFHEPDVHKKGMTLGSSFQVNLEAYYDRFKGEYWHISDVYLGHIGRLKREVNKYTVQVYSLELMLKEIVNKNYPKQLEVLTVDQVEEEVKGTAGRDYDESAPQKKIEKFIKEAIKKARNEEPGFKVLWHFTGPHKGKPNKTQLQERIREEDLTGWLGKEAIRDRVNKALSKLGY